MPLPQKSTPDEIYRQIEARLRAAGVRTEPYRTIAYGLQFKVSTGAWSVLLRVYLKKSGAVTIDYSQVKNSQAEAVLKAAITGTPEAPMIPQKNPFTPGTPPDLAALPLLIGSDESGKGDYFGPLVVAAVCLDEKGSRKLREAGVADSKTLSDQENRSLTSLIKEVAVDVSVIALAPDQYNTRYAATAAAGGSLNDLLASLHATALSEVAEKTGCTTALVDQFARERVLQDLLTTRCPDLRVVQRPRAEQETVVAAASVLARARFLKDLDLLGEPYHVHLQKGASAGVNRQAAELVDRYGAQVLRSLAKVHFRTTAKVCRDY
jgi:ribonuclease HIII